MDTPRRRPIALTGAPSTTGHATLNLLSSAYGAPIHGQMVTFDQDIIDPQTGFARTERALGTVTEVETVNASRSPRSLEANHIAHGLLAAENGEGDTRSVDVSVEAVFRQDHDAEAAPGSHEWTPGGASLSNSPATGTNVHLVDQHVVDQLMVGVENQRFLGTLRGSSTVVPWTMRDFSGPRGAWHACIAGATGSGKTGTAFSALACDLYFPHMGHIIFDPQAQIASEYGTVFSLQGLAAALGRKVTVVRLSRTLRLRKDAPMFTDLLARVDFFRELSFGAGSADQIAAAATVIGDALDDKKLMHAATGTDDWTEADAADLLEYVLEYLRDVLPTGTVYAGKDGQDRVRYAIRKPTPDEMLDEGSDPAAADRFRDGILDERHSDGRRWRKALSRFAPIHNMWSPYTPEGARRIATGTPADDLESHEKRRKAWGLMSEVFTHTPDAPAPILIIDLSADVDPALMNADVDDEDAAAADEARAALDHPGVKARVMRQLIGDLGRAGMAAFKGGNSLNVRTWFDESWAYAGPADATTDKDVARLGDQLEDGARDLRKLGIGLTFILQAVSGLREGIWKQCGQRIIGYGLTEASDTKRLANVIGDQHLRLYLSTAGPEATGKYSFMMIGGGATGLSFGAKPVFIDMFTDPEDWLKHNQSWVTEQRRRYAHLLPAGDHGGPLTHMPPRPPQDAYIEDVRHKKGLKTGAANQAAASKLTHASKPAGGFGMPTVKSGESEDDYGPPPF